MKQTQTIPAVLAAQMLKAAQKAWQERDLRQSIDILEHARRLDPANGVVLLQLGRYHGMCYNYAAAEKCFAQAVRLATRKTEVMAFAAELSMDFASPHLAERYWGLALKQKDASAEMFARLAEFYERLFQYAEARELLRRALELNGACPAALLIGARLDRHEGRLDDAEKALRKFLSKARREVRIRGYYELGAVLDRLGRYDEAMAAWREAKELLRADVPPLLPKFETFRSLIKERQAEITAEVMKRWFDFGAQLQPARRLSLLGGHPRSGTTLLEQVLDSHPEIVSAGEAPVFMNEVLKPLNAIRPEEPPLLAALEQAGAGALQRARANYFRGMEQHLGRALGDRLLMDKNPALTAFIPAYARVFPEMKILVALRDPRDVVLSCFMQAYVPLSLGSVAYQSLERAVDVYTLVMGGWRATAGVLKNPWLEVRYEDLVENLAGAARRVLDFLAVPWNPRILAFHEHARRRRVRSPAYADVVHPVFKRAVGRWQNYRQYLEPHLKQLEPLVKAFGYD